MIRHEEIEIFQLRQWGHGKEKVNNGVILGWSANDEFSQILVVDKKYAIGNIIVQV